MRGGWYRIYEGPEMLRPGTDIALLNARQKRMCGVCAGKFSLVGVPMEFQEPIEADDKADCFYCGSEIVTSLQVAS